MEPVNGLFKPSNSNRTKPTLVQLLVPKLLGPVIDGKVDGPGREVAQHHWEQAAIHAAHALVAPYRARRAHEPSVRSHRRPGTLGSRVSKAALRLKFRLDNVQGTGHDAGRDAADGAAD